MAAEEEVLMILLPNLRMQQEEPEVLITAAEAGMELQLLNMPLMVIALRAAAEAAEECQP